LSQKVSLKENRESNQGKLNLRGIILKNNNQDKFENLAVSNSLLVQAILGILVKKGIAIADEILETVDEVKKKWIRILGEWQEIISYTYS
jgi:hypothetical protein